MSTRSEGAQAPVRCAITPLSGRQRKQPRHRRQEACRDAQMLRAQALPRRRLKLLRSSDRNTQQRRPLL